MRNIFFFLMLACLATMNAQITVRGKLTDRKTNEPVISASIGIKGKASGTISNEEGVFQLSVSKEDQIVVSCLGYQTMAVPASDLSDETKSIFLEQSDEMLEEVIVTKLPLYQILTEVIATSRARFNKPILLQTYYREFLKMNGKYSNFADGIIDYHIKGNTKKTASDLIVRQNRSFNLKEDEDEESWPTMKVGNGIVNSYDFRFFSSYILDDKQYEDYDFELKSRTNKEGGQMLVMNFSPKDGLEKFLFRGSVLYDPKTKLVYDLEMHVDPAHVQYAKQTNMLVARFSYQEYRFRAAYKMVGNNYVLSYNNRFTKLKVWNKTRNYLIENRSDQIVTDFHPDTDSYDKKMVFKKKFLYQKPTSFTTNFWQQNNAIVLTSEEEKIISDLEKNAVPNP